MGLFDKFQPTATVYNALKESAGRDPFGVSMEEMKGPTRAIVEGARNRPCGNQ